MKKILLILSLALSVLSCEQGDIRPEQEFTTSPKIVGFAKKFETVSYFSNVGQVEQKFKVNYIGGGDGKVFDQDVEISYAIDPSSTAVVGQEFNFVNTSGKIILPAGKSFADFPLLVNTGGLNPTMPTELVINLTSSTNGVISANDSKFKVVFVGCQSNLKTGTGAPYTVVVTSNTGVVRTYTAEVVREITVNNLKTRTTGQWSFGQIPSGGDQGYEFTDICGALTMPDGTLFGFYSNTVKGLDSFAGDDGKTLTPNSFTTKYEISFAAGPRQFTAVYTR
jgi:hypothetical protein